MVAAIQVQVRLWQYSASGWCWRCEKIPGWSGLTGGVCWLVYLLVKAGTGSMILGAFLSSLSVALWDICLPGFSGAVSVFLVPGILPLVPGTSIYNSVYYVIRNSREESMYYLVETLQIAGAIALAVFLMDSVFKLVGKKKRIKV